ncbi:muconolactone Delta-isomerase [Bradyrhizobium sp. AUGA SZCCT0431]|uniref:muconolactone Delta-isomerase n=1 Tax=Bradyrhizobium sp. AUGA SZCCT0431 TaxID=2807674 RepID=UPI001BAD0BEF|nr:muconolactone Delta-isomerase [Bradyrhizobium sp. AUGA SZCCT0431]MBR1147192.1 muconolactone Delta-isomerase [Bradyrhizobium sp. AUGA SZCCT0431]
MLYMVEMTVELPTDLGAEKTEALIAAERNYAQELQRQGKWRHLWRVTGRYANVSIFDVESHDALHETLIRLPLWRYLKINVTPLSKHPSSID